MILPHDTIQSWGSGGIVDSKSVLSLLQMQILIDHKLKGHEPAIYFRRQRATTGVFIPINEWNELKRKYKDIEREDIHLPEWHKDLISQRFDDYHKNPDSALDFDGALDDIEKDL